MYVYRTSVFEQRIIKHEQLYSKIERLCQEFETMNFKGIHTRFKVLHSYLKRKEGNFRIIAKILQINREPILCLLKIFSRGEPAYKRFLEASKYDTQLFQKAELESDLIAWLQEQKSKSPINPLTLETLPEELRFCLERPDWRNDYNDIIVHESETWCETFKQQEIRDQATTFRQLIEDIVNDFDSIGNSTNYPQVKVYGNNNYYLLFKSLLTEDEVPQQVLLLIVPLANYPQPEVIDNIKVTTKENQFKWWIEQDNLTLENLITYTKRSYPAYILLEEDFWLKIQNGDRVNLALSQEEKELLDTVSTKKSLPLFLNGRAGSGKSTMLFYLFAYYCYRHLELCQIKNRDFLTPPHPLFLTYSKNLSEYARERVQSLLRYHHHFVEETSKFDRIPSFGSFFQSFRAFLLKLLPASERQKFSEDNHVSFHLFRQECQRRTPQFSPEKSWLVIQNFIKGYRLEQENTYLESELEYSKIPKKEQKVSVEEFAEIRDHVWNWYQKYTQDHNLWDDRDLIRIILSRKYYKSQYTVIFCDEAQDFTRLELKLIMQLSVFSRYNLAQEPILSLPFAFAGDPLQTLNPTGFRWSGFQAAFHEEILSALILARTPYLRIELKQLSYNYRSVATIVKVNNLIQLWRKLLYNFSDLEPQQARKNQGLIPQKFIIDHDSKINTESLLEIIKDTIILIPCDEGEEVDFIQQDELLHHFLESEVELEIPWNILSAITAKGLEFKQVLLYKFGQRCPENLWDEESGSIEEGKYFLNKLYVAASRPTERLFIIDCPLGESKLWHHLNNQDLVTEKIFQIKNPEQRENWQANIQLIDTGQSLEYINNDDLEANALSFETVGINTENPEFLKRAIAAYKKCHNLHKVKFCQAWKTRLERKFTEAGALFLQLEHIPEAAECFWQGSDWSQLRQLLGNKTHDQQLNSCLSRLQLLFPLVDFMATIDEANRSLKIRQITKQIISFCNFLLVEHREKIFTEEYHTNPWQTGLIFYQQAITQISYKSDIFSTTEWLKIIHSLEYWFESENREINLLIAKCWYLEQDYHQAIKIWESLGAPVKVIPAEDITYYYLAKAKIATLPAGLEYLAIAKQYHIIINQWIKTGKSLDASWLKYIAIAFAETNNIAQALTIYCYLNDLAQVQKYWLKLIQTSRAFPIKYLQRILQFYLEKEHWQEAIKLAEYNLKIRDFKYYFVYRLAFSALTPSKLDGTERERYQNLIANNILNDIEWQKYFSLPLLGVVLEKIGFGNFTLAFYEQYTNSNKVKIRNFSRSRWLSTKQRQLEYFHNAKNLTKAQKTLAELTLKAKTWNLATKSISTAIPEIARKRTKSLLKASNFGQTPRKNLPQINPKLKIKGLQKNVAVEAVAYGIQQFQLHHLIVRIMLSTKKITIIDLLSNHAIYLDGTYGTLKTDTTTILASENQPLSFRESQGQYYGTLWCHPRPRLELNLEIYPEKISIEFENL
ncbi:MAG: UvrD-helicase domain-containing protein [Cyanobacteria bacterium P01_F01_bin.143]